MIAQKIYFVPGHFDVQLKAGESVVISTSLKEENPSYIKRQWAAEVKKRTPRDNYEHCLQNAAEEFIIRKNNKTEVVAGYPWFGRWGRDTFIALPGLTLTRNDVKSFKDVTKTMLGELKDGLFPNVGHGKAAAYNQLILPYGFSGHYNNLIIIKTIVPISGKSMVQI